MAAEVRRLFTRVFWRGLALLSLAGAAATAQTNFAILTSDGAWTWYNDPRALFHNGTLFFGYVRNTDGASVLSAFAPLTGMKTDMWTSSRTERDDHDNAGLLVKQDGTLLAVQARHGTDQFFVYRLSTGTNPVSPADWGPEQALTATGAGLTYANPYQLSAEGGRIYEFSRDLNFNPTLFISDDGGSSWSPPQLFIRTGTGSIRPYVKYACDGVQRIDFLYTDGHPRDVTNSLYHLYCQNQGLYKTDGTFVKSLTNLPVLHDSGERGSVIYQYSDVNTTNFNDHIPSGRAWCWETAYQSNGWPVSVFTVQRDRVTGSNWYDDRIYYYYARWTGTNWQKRFIAQAGRPLFNPENDYAGGICLNPNEPSVIYLSSNAADPFNTSDITNVALRASERYELWRGITSDGGLTFAWTQITTNSAKDNLRPYIPRGQTGTPAIIWFRGVYTTFNSYDCEVVGLFNQPVPVAPQLTLVTPVGGLANLSNQNNGLRLTATVTDDGLPGPLRVHWSTISGPTNAVFLPATNADTVASFPLPGSYVARLSADDTLSTNTLDVRINVAPAGGDGPDATRVLWLKLDESSGTNAADSSGYSNNGAVSGGALFQPTGGVHGGAMKFDGLSGLITVADSPQLDNTAAFALTYWFRADAYPGDSAGLVCKRTAINTANTYTTYLKAADRRIYVDIDSSNNRFASTTLIQTGLWYHVAVVFDGSLPPSQRAALYINGVLDITAAESSAAIPDYSSTMMLGNTHPGAVDWFNGLIDDARFYRRALSAGEIALLGGANFAPSIVAGPISNPTSALPASVTGRVLDDGNGGPLTAHWSVVSGPGSARFANSNLVATTVTFTRAGAYVLRLSGSDSQAETSADLPVSVGPNLNVYADWIEHFYPGISDPAITGSAGDPDLDRSVNFAEFALGMRPDQSDAVPFGNTTPGLPKPVQLADQGTNYLGLAVKRLIGRLGVSYVAEVSPDCATWSAAVATGTVVNNGDGTEIIFFRDSLPISAQSVRFMRLKVIEENP